MAYFRRELLFFFSILGFQPSQIFAQSFAASDFMLLMYNSFLRMPLKDVLNMHLLVAKVCVTKKMPISQNEMPWWLRLQIVTIT